MNRQGRIRLTTFALSALVYFPFSEWISTTSIGTMLLVQLQILYLLPMLAAPLATPVLLVCLCFARTRRASRSLLPFCLLLIACCIGGNLLGNKARKAGMQAFAARSQPLIAAIFRYERDHAAPPPTLQDLVPDYLPAVPSTGMMAYPEYHYHVGEQAADGYDGNPWALAVFTPSGGINFDQMLYFPRQNYPAQGHGGWLEPIGDWAYVHE